ncbi:guanosine-3',5'-bis(diphosphate) 3'-pyrophosphohydrolase [Acinetobacter courvalinii]|uniref:guanosine-3',5'-bis(diphosphate) 3'-pyrophosphohydrolase n=1 Tax=Acinetobacter courvalinii TaxID=280147 RepID=UPI0021D17287|nr:guanosine-3',5'-bis(diphosphate) 3'-pyrophosphohydrolase [Acinetobacter courvalinii]MCU4366862.1 guanosine-3',5'-bis(diphosphate) 3'-pyrophosphohydrolase [Acinetobacter courvalinii]MCU4445067.1 guanosine-3',5'-bis(diphosphate) 3'-pyrophosphohydrolase [Acinetobacter courvalinii]
MATLERAISLAAERHAGQVDKADAPYILHPLRVMLNMPDIEHKIVAVLHDILEDTATTMDELYALGFPMHLIEAIVALTQQQGESRIQAVQRTVQNPIARIVKLADLTDNMDLSRIQSPTMKDFERLKQYQQVRDILLSQNV